MSQIIIIESAEAFARELARALLNDITRSVEKTLLSCLHPIEVPSEAEELVNKVREYINCNPKKGGKPIMRLRLTDSQCARLIESYSRRVPRAMLDEIWLIGNRSRTGQKDIDTADIAAKYDVEVDGR